MLLLCCNLLSLPDGGSTTEWPEGVSICIISATHTHTAQSMCCQVMSAERNPEGIPVRLRDLGIQKWVKGLDPSRVGICCPHLPLRRALRCVSARCASVFFFDPTHHSLGHPPAPPLPRRRPHNKPTFPCTALMRDGHLMRSRAPTRPTLRKLIVLGWCMKFFQLEN